MINKLTYIESLETSPYVNLAMEEYLLFHCAENECILYLWQNKNTVVIGKNQNAWKECRVSKMEEDGAHLARRLSGGGAVYHDLGNLNFTFLVRGENYDVAKQTSVILKAVEKLGIQAMRSGRNDLLIDGKKFSGHAYYKQGDYCYHHGTLMVNVSMDELSKYLNVSEDKLRSKGVKSVKSRVTNLKDYAPDMTMEQLKEKLIEAFEEEYGHKAECISQDDLDEAEIAKNREKYGSWDWRFGQKFDFQYELSQRFTWGGVTVQFQVQNGKIADTAIYSDAMRTDFLVEISKYLKNIPYSKRAICAELSLYWSSDKEEELMVKDIISWLEQEEL